MSLRGLPRNYYSRLHEQLDPIADQVEIVHNIATREFPWDTLNSLSFALFRTYAVPSIGVLLHDTGEFTERVQKRYDDTGLLLEEVLEHGFEDVRGLAAVRRINQMHRMYDISNDDMLYVLSTFVVVPVRWLEQYGYRPMSEKEIVASTDYYRVLGKHMNIADMPADYEGFAQLLDDYEAAHFAYDPRARKVADATLQLMTTFSPNNLVPAWVAKRIAFCLMDEPLRRAFRYPNPTRLEQAVVRWTMNARKVFLRLRPARREKHWFREFGYYKSYPNGYRTEELGTFTPGCPVPHSAPSQRQG
ncbi:MAG: oxygenase MpaB family protein [Marmoricola sp.]